MSEYQLALKGYYNYTCSKVLSALLEYGTTRKIMKGTQNKEIDENILFKYLIKTANQAYNSKATTGNSSYYSGFLEIFRRILLSCAKNEDLKLILHKILSRVVIQGTLKSLLKNQELKYIKAHQLFNDEDVASISFNFYLLQDLVKWMIRCCPDIVLNSKCYTHLINALLVIPLSFRNDRRIKTEIYMVIYTLIYSKVKVSEHSLNFVKTLLSFERNLIKFALLISFLCCW